MLKSFCGPKFGRYGFDSTWGKIIPQKSSKIYFKINKILLFWGWF
jgi:hypothetical protein